MTDTDDATFAAALAGLERGDFSHLEPLFEERSAQSGMPRVIEWLDDGRFRDHPNALAEALTCASFLDTNASH